MLDTLTHRRSLLFAAMLIESPLDRAVLEEPEELAIGRALAHRLVAALPDPPQRARAAETLRLAASSV
jgi:hypothetical protein